MQLLSLACSLAMVCFAAVHSEAQTPLYDINTIQKIEIYFSQSNWDYQMDTAKAGAQGYIMSDWVKVNGIQFDSAGVKYKGNSSYDAAKIKNPLHINLKKFKSQNYSGTTDIKLSNCYQDPSMIREPLAYAMLANYMDCPRSNFAQVYINGSYVGLYSNDEDIDKPFLKDHFYTYSANKNAFFKCSHDNPTPITKCNIKYISSDSSQYFSLYEMKSNVGWNELVKLCDTVTNYASNIGSYMDMDRAIWMLACNNLMVNLDSYTGLFVQNYYLYKDNTGRFNPIMWDLNMAFGGFPYAGSQGGGLGSLTVTNMQQLSQSIHSTDNDWPLLNAVMNNAMYKRMYIAHMRTMVNEMIVSNYYQTLAQQMQTLVDTAVQSDPNKGYTYAQFQAGMTANTIVGSYTVPGISNLMTARATYLQGTAEFTATPPTIANVQYIISGGNVTISANVTNTNSNAVYAGYRFDTTNKFTRVLMYDDGAHGDGASGDNVYGITVSMDSSRGQYYVYAENSNAGMFSPQRAEHEFHRMVNPLPVNDVNSVAGRLQVYPNPATNAVTIATSLNVKTTLSIKNTIGQAVLQRDIQQQATIDISGFAPGLYYVQCGGCVQKLLIQH